MTTVGAHLPCPGAVRVEAARSTIVLGRIGFDRYTSRQGMKLQMARAPGGGYFSKIGLFLRGRVTAQLKVPEGAPDSVRLTGWTAERPTRTVTIRQDAGPGCWTPYPGGFVFKQPVCLDLEVAVDGHVERVPFGLGRNCS